MHHHFIELRLYDYRLPQQKINAVNDEENS